MKMLNNPGKALELAPNIGTVAASKNPKLFAATAPDYYKKSFIKERVYFSVKFINYYQRFLVN